MDRAPLLVFSHLRWDSVVQRPQHVMSRIARERDVLFIEDPVNDGGAARLDIRRVGPRLEVATPTVSTPGPGFHDGQRASLEPLLRETLTRRDWFDFAAWLYTPMAVRLARALGPRAVVYDCMDEPSACLDAPAEMIERERELMRCADVVFTGGPSLYRSKKDRHPFVRCFPSSVDVAHFERASRASDPSDQADWPRPRFGYAGVLDERIDMSLLSALADHRPDASIVLVGPVATIDPDSVPRRPNIHAIGPREHADLPAYMSGWDVCLMPFAQGPQTRSLSPTHVLEYMAAGRPIASTSLPDVAEPYGDIVLLGDSPDGFVAACERALNEPESDRAARAARARAVLRRTSWDDTARRMDEILRYVADSGPARLEYAAANTGARAAMA